jgi:ArsR family transcriptional regulator
MKKNNDDVCKSTVIHNEIVEEVKKKVPEDEFLYDMAEFFKIFGDSTRIKILTLLFHSEMCVCDISFALNISQSAVSHQLRILRQSKLVKFRKDGKVVYYSLDDDHIKQIYNMAFEHLKEGEKN